MAQRSILTFFKPPTTSSTNTLKRKCANDNVSGIQGDNPKKLCTGDDETCKERSVVSNEQKFLHSAIEENHWKAKIKLQSKRTPALSANIGISWFKALENEFLCPYFLELSRKLVQEKSTVYPPMDMVYTWTRLCDIKDVKVVILGQDPYHGPGQAHGLAFSVPVGVAIPPSLVNIFKEIAADISDFKVPKHGYLKGWAMQGVLLLNASLTVRAHNANSHQDWGWQKLTDAVIKWIDKNLSNVVFLLWGAFAQKKSELVNKKKHAVLCAPHPSPLSASRGFFGCRHFSKANEYLQKHGKSPIDWNDLPVV